MQLQLTFAAALLALLSGCVTPAVTQVPTQPIDFGNFKTVSYKVHSTPTTEYGSDMQYAESTISLLDALLGKKLTELGYVPPNADVPPDLAVDVAVSAVKEGSAATRFWVGFGAGRALLLFDASFQDSHGLQLASFQGGRSYTGMEFGSSFAGKDEIQTMAATRAVRQIEEFMRNGGRFLNSDEKQAGSPAAGPTSGPISRQVADPISAPSGTPHRSKQERLTELKSLHEAGLIGDEVYANLQKEILSEP